MKYYNTRPGSLARFDPIEPGRLCADAGGAGVVRPDAADEPIALRSVLGVAMDPGEIVILVCRRSVWIDAAVGIAAGLAAGTLAWIMLRATGRPMSATPIGFVAIIAASLIFILEHVRRLYVLTDRRVHRRDRRLTRVDVFEAPLVAVKRVGLMRNDAQARVGAGTVVFETNGRALVWSSVGDAARVHEIAEQAVQRYGGSMRGM